MAQDGVIFEVRGNSVDAYRSFGGKTSIYGGSLPITCVADAAAIGGTAIDMTGPTTRSLSFPGLNNIPETAQFSANMCVSFGYTGAPAATRGLWQMSSGQGTGFAYMLGIWHDTSARIRAFLRNNNGQVIASVNFATLLPTFGQYYDVTVTMGGSTAANSFKLYIDTVVGQATPGTSSPINMTQAYREVSLGGGPLATATDIKVSEFSVWGNTIILPASVMLESGMGALNGMSRTSFVAASLLDGSIYTNLGISLALNTGSWTFAGVGYTGTYVAPGASSVLNTVSYGIGTTGTYAPVAATAVINTVSFGLGTTGTIVLPAAGDVRDQTTYGPSATITGTLQAGGGTTTVIGTNLSFLGFGNTKLGG